MVSLNSILVCYLVLFGGQLKASLALGQDLGLGDVLGSVLGIVGNLTTLGNLGSFVNGSTSDVSQTANNVTSTFGAGLEYGIVRLGRVTASITGLVFELLEKVNSKLVGGVTSDVGKVATELGQSVTALVGTAVQIVNSVSGTLSSSGLTNVIGELGSLTNATRALNGTTSASKSRRSRRSTRR